MGTNNNKKYRPKNSYGHVSPAGVPLRVKRIARIRAEICPKSSISSMRRQSILIQLQIGGRHMGCQVSEAPRSLPPEPQGPLRGRGGRRGVRMLIAGPPETGPAVKTTSPPPDTSHHRLGGLRKIDCEQPPTNRAQPPLTTTFVLTRSGWQLGCRDVHTNTAAHPSMDAAASNTKKRPSEARQAMQPECTIQIGIPQIQGVDPPRRRHRRRKR